MEINPDDRDARAWFQRLSQPKSTMEADAGHGE
jgi:hypothetical protein